MYRYRHFKSAIAYVETTNPAGDRGIGSAFHVGEGVFVTAKHVVDGRSVESIATTLEHKTPVKVDPVQGVNEWTTIGPFDGKPSQTLIADAADVAILVWREAAQLPALRLAKERDRETARELVLRSAIVMGYPPVPMTNEPILLALNAEVSAIVEPRDNPPVPIANEPILLALNAEVSAIVEPRGNPDYHYVVSSMARGGFSGGPLIYNDFNPVVIGLITQSLCESGKPLELGYMAALSANAIVACLQRHNMMPAEQLLEDYWQGGLRSKR